MRIQLHAGLTKRDTWAGWEINCSNQKLSRLMNLQNHVPEGTPRFMLYGFRRRSNRLLEEHTAAEFLSTAIALANSLSPYSCYFCSYVRLRNSS